MPRRIAAIVLIYAALAVAWAVLGGSIHHRTWSTDDRLHTKVASLWGEPQTQLSPELVFSWQEEREVKERVENPETKERTIVTRRETVWLERPVILDRSHLRVSFDLDQRKKGLLWYSTYGVDLDADYSYRHDEPIEGVLIITYRFPTANAIYDGFRLDVAGVSDPKAIPVTEGQAKVVRHRVPVRAGTTVPFRIAYRSRGLDSWSYSFGADVNRVKDFEMTMDTDFEAIDFPQGTISPSRKERRGEGWRLVWKSENLISGFQVGMDMPRRLNPGPLAAEISFFAPVSLAFFFVWMFVITLFKQIDLHPINYVFLGAAFFAFALLFSYTVDHIPLVPAFLLASAVSIFLVVSYLRLVAGLRFAALEAGLSQLVYLVLFAYAHFIEGYTGLIVTIGSILTLFMLMQMTGRIRWSEKFPGPAGAPALPSLGPL